MRHQPLGHVSLGSALFTPPAFLFQAFLVDWVHRFIFNGVLMSGVRFFMVLVVLPALIVLGHDAYLFYNNQPEGFRLSAAGFLWTKYSPGTFMAARDSFEGQDRETLNFILQQKALFLALAFAFFFYFILAVLQIFRIGPFRRERKSYTGSNRLDDVLSRGDKKRRKL